LFTNARGFITTGALAAPLHHQYNREEISRDVDIQRQAIAK